MTEEEQELFDAYKKETENCYEIANLLDQINPELPGAFAGTPSERIWRQLSATKGIPALNTRICGRRST